jgi:hypothetical protein
MAGIDKTYTNSYKDYREFKDWANKQKLTFFDGHYVCIGDWVWYYEEEDFNSGEIPIMNTPIWLDIYLIQNCKSQFVLDRMREVYDEATYEYFKNVNLTAAPSSELQQNRKITIKPSNNCKFPFKKKMWNKPIGGKINWWLQCNDDFWYNSETKTWTHYESYYPHDTNTAHITSIKALIRHLRKQYLPKGITFTLSGRYIGEEYTILIH